MGRRRAWVIALLSMGLLVWAWVEYRAAEERKSPEGAAPDTEWVRLLIAAAAAGLSFLPPVRRGMNRLLNRIRHPAPRALERAAVAIASLSAGYFITTALLQQRD